MGITEAEIFNQCKRYRSMEVDEVWNSIGPDYVLEESVKPLPAPTAPNAMSEEQVELANNDFMDKLVDSNPGPYVEVVAFDVATGDRGPHAVGVRVESGRAAEVERAYAQHNPARMGD